MKQMRAVAQLRVNGTEVSFVVDSGGFFSMLTPAAAAQLNLKSYPLPENFAIAGITGRAEARMVRVDKLGLQDAELKNREFLVGGNENGGGTVGLLGRNVLDMRDTEYDLVHGAVRMMYPGEDCADQNLAYWAGTTPVVTLPLITRSGEKLPPIRAMASINGKPVKAVFDTGAHSMLSLAAAKRIGLVDDEKQLERGPPVFGIGKEEAPSWFVTVKSFELGGESITNSRLRVVDIDQRPDIDMVIGIDFFLSHRIYVARSQGKMFLTYSGGPVFDMSQKMETPVLADTDGADDPQDADGLARRGTAFATRGELKLGLADLDRAVELAPAVSSYRVQRAHVQLALKNSAAASADLDEALRLDPQADDARIDRVMLRLAGGDKDAARADLQVLDGHVPTQSDLRRRMGEAFIVMKEPLLAVPQFDQWIAARPNEARLYLILNARCWARALANAQLDKALDDCNDALDAKPKSPEFLDSRGLVHLRLGDWKKAIADYDAALAQNPKIAWSLWGRGIARLHTGDREPGLADLAAAQAVNAKIESDAKGYGLDVPELTATGEVKP